MGPFSKHSSRHATPSGSATNTNGDQNGLPAPATASKKQRGLWAKIIGSHDVKYDKEDRLNRLPTFKQWIRLTWVDILTMIAMALVLFGTSRSEPISNRYFPIVEGPNKDIVVNPDYA